MFNVLGHQVFRVSNDRGFQENIIGRVFTNEEGFWDLHKFGEVNQATEKISSPFSGNMRMGEQDFRVFREDWVRSNQVKLPVQPAIYKLCRNAMWIAKTGNQNIGIDDDLQ